MSSQANSFVPALQAAYETLSDGSDKKNEQSLVTERSNELPSTENELEEISTGAQAVSSAMGTAHDPSPDDQDVESAISIPEAKEDAVASSHAEQQEDRISLSRTLYEDIWAELCTRHPSTWREVEVPPGFLVRLSASIAATAMPVMWNFVTFPRPASNTEIGDEHNDNLQQPVWHIPDHLLEQVGHTILDERDQMRHRIGIPAVRSWPPSIGELVAGTHERQQFWLRIFAGRALPESLRMLENDVLLRPVYAPYEPMNSAVVNASWPTSPPSTSAFPAVSRTEPVEQDTVVEEKKAEKEDEETRLLERYGGEPEHKQLEKIRGELWDEERRGRR